MIKVKFTDSSKQFGEKHLFLELKSIHYKNDEWYGRVWIVEDEFDFNYAKSIECRIYELEQIG